ncbi:spore germination protein [Alkalihalobacillus deserti]|uniref:spore germination protein n=1 Tax=Alkalihalobacillus deserti TaxID=2879466 RepID=UPI001D13C3E8|nr:spore germination protein [Alkalihalobacillus deserti]
MGYIKKNIRRTWKKKRAINDNNGTQQKELLNVDLQENIQKVKKAFGNSSDLVVKEFFIDEERQAGILYTDGLVDSDILNDSLESIMIDKKEFKHEDLVHTRINIIDFYKKYVVSTGEVKDVEDFETLYTAVLSGDTVFVVDSCSKGLIFSTRGWEQRAIEEPTSQTVIRGPKEAFTETLRTNTALIRRKIKSNDLWLETKVIGRLTKTDVAIMYMNGIVNPKVVEEVHERLDRIDIDGIFESGNIEELIEDETYTPFPTILNTERPDAVAASLLEGRVAIFVDGTPFVLLVPTLFIQYLQSSEDYYQRFDIATLIRLLRIICFFIALLAPSLYIAITTFHQEMLPTELLISIAAQREGVPFPAFLEALIMEITFEILREAGVRMPRAVGSAISIVGALVLGQAAVEAGIVSPVMVIVVAITAISNFVFPSISMATAIRILRFILIALAASFGLYGIAIALIAMILHLCSLRSFGVPYMSPMAPFNLPDQKDTLFRLPLWALFSRPRLISQQNIIREQNPAPQKPKKERS